MTQLIQLGQINGAFKLRGAVKLNSSLKNLEDLKDKKVLLKCDKNNEDILLTVEEIQRLNLKRWIVKFKNIDTIIKAKELNLRKLYVNRAFFNLKKDEYLLNDLLEMKVYDQTNKLLGKVEDILETKGQDILVVKNSENEILIPNINEFVKNIDFENNVIKVELIDGMGN